MRQQGLLCCSSGGVTHQLHLLSLGRKIPRHPDNKGEVNLKENTCMSVENDFFYGFNGIMVSGWFTVIWLMHPNKGESLSICGSVRYFGFLGGNHKALPYIFDICCNLEICWIWLRQLSLVSCPRTCSAHFLCQRSKCCSTGASGELGTGISCLWQLWSLLYHYHYHPWKCSRMFHWKGHLPSFFCPSFRLHYQHLCWNLNLLAAPFLTFVLGVTANIVSSLTRDGFLVWRVITRSQSSNNKQTVTSYRP